MTKRHHLGLFFIAEVFCDSEYRYDTFDPQNIFDEHPKKSDFHKTTILLFDERQTSTDVLSFEVLYPRHIHKTSNLPVDR